VSEVPLERARVWLPPAITSELFTPVSRMTISPEKHKKIGKIGILEIGVNDHPLVEVGSEADRGLRTPV